MQMSVLNSRAWAKSDSPRRHPPTVAAELLTFLKTIVDSVTDSSFVGKNQARSIASLSGFDDFVTRAGELQLVQLARLENNERLCFFLNVYNMLILHAVIIRGPPSGGVARTSLYSSCKYLLGDIGVVSSVDLEHMYLRGATSRPSIPLASMFIPKLSERDPKSGFSVAPEPRVSFALCCGARSSPPLIIYYPEIIEEQLEKMTKYFLEQTIRLDVEKLYLPRVLDWYKHDFSFKSWTVSVPEQLISYVARYLSPPLAKRITNVSLSGTIKVDFLNYEWNTYYYGTVNRFQSRLPPLVVLPPSFNFTSSSSSPPSASFVSSALDLSVVSSVSSCLPYLAGVAMSSSSSSSCDSSSSSSSSSDYNRLFFPSSFVPFFSSEQSRNSAIMAAALGGDERLTSDEDEDAERLVGMSLNYRPKLALLSEDEKSILNSRTWPGGECRRSPCDLAAGLLQLLKTLVDSITNSTSISREQARSICSLPGFGEFTSRTSELQVVQLTSLSNTERLCFFLNIYNLLVMHAVVVRGPPTNALERTTFFANSKYLIGELGSVNPVELEHRYLRANSCRPSIPFSSLVVPKLNDGDARNVLGVDAEPRVSFALCCGAMSSPPVLIYRPETINQDLDVVVKLVLDQQVRIDGDSVFLPYVFEWYKNDFTTKSWATVRSGQLLTFVASYLHTPESTKILALAKKTTTKVEYVPYDWQMYYYGTLNRYNSPRTIKTTLMKMRIELESDSNESGGEWARHSPLSADDLTPASMSASAFVFPKLSPAATDAVVIHTESKETT